MKIHEIISEAPIQDFKTIGNFERNSSFRDPRDRKILTNPKAVEIIKKKFGNTDVDFNLYFVNSPMANKQTEVGKVSLEWVTKNLGEEASSQINMNNDAINIVFTNNKGDERVAMTPWIMAHRIAHVFIRNSYEYNMMANAYTDFLNYISDDIFQAYGIRKFPRNYSNFLRDNDAQKILQLFMHSVGNFKSARDGNLRNGVEALHEMFAQYIITGKVTFRGVPTSFGNKAWGRNKSYRYRLDDPQEMELDEYNNIMRNAGESLAQEFDRVLGSSVGAIFVM